MDVAEITLRIVSADDILLHEGQDPLVVGALAQRLKQDRILRNPPIVSEAEGRYIVLDGATRTGALRALGLEHSLVQIVDYAAREISLSSWHHLIQRTSPSEFFDQLAALENVTVERVDVRQAEHNLTLHQSLCYLLLRNGAAYQVRGAEDLEQSVFQLNQIVALYRGKTQVYRAVTTQLDMLTREYPDLSIVVVFPCYTPFEVTRLALNGAKLPMGITRHLIGGRAIGVNIPLERLASAESLEEKNAWLQKWLMEKIHERKVRFYQEPLFVFDE
ncbi:MAG: hypothetical protein HY782_24895 [Chloroflexi bacterium]|nr:hypothetical protein [Chloroflexota bacterium]